MKSKLKQYAPIVYFIGPAFVIYFTFMIYPLFDSIRIGFYQNVDNSQVFVGFKNYIELFSNPVRSERFWKAFNHSLVFVAVNMFIQNPLALFIASILAQKIKGNVFYRTILFAPATLSLVVVAFIWKMLLNPLWGIPTVLFSKIGLEQFAVPVLGLESTALITLALISAWQYIGVPISLYFARLISISDSIIEAATIDGATPRKIFWHIKFPLVVPMVGIISLMTFLANFAQFDVVYAVKGGFAGPNFSTDTLMTFFFRTFFGYYNSPSNPYLGASIAGAMMIVLLGAVVIFVIWRNRQETYEF